ncbi:MAG: outer membrane beta-barrel protein [Pseudomonadota bacterium]
MTGCRVFGAAIYCIALFSQGQAIAQIEPEGLSWADIERPEFDPLGIRVGSFDIFASVTSRLDYDSNVFASASDQQVDDALMSIRPQIDLKSNWSVHKLDLAAFADSTFYTSLGTEDHTDYGLSVSSRIDVSRQTRVFAAFGYRRYFEDRAAIDTRRNTQNPIELQQLQASASLAHRFNKAELVVSADIAGFDARDGRLRETQAVVGQDFRDFTSVGGKAALSYEVSPGYAAFVSAQVRDGDFDLRPGDLGFGGGGVFDRNFSTRTIDAGFTAEVTQVIYATLALGRLTIDLDDPRLDDISAVSARADVLWNFSPISSFILKADRAASPTNDPIVPVRLDTSITVGIDHELLYNLTFKMRGRYARFDFDGISRTDEEVGGSVAVRYLISNRLQARATYRYAQRKSDAVGFNFGQHRMGISLEFSL